MTPTRAQLDAAEARHLKEWRTLVRHRRHVRIELAAKRPFVVAGTLKRCDEAREQVATAIRAIRAQRKALDAAVSEAAPRLYVAMELLDYKGQFEAMHIAHLMESGSMNCEVMGSGKTEREARDDLAATAARFHASLGAWLAARGAKP